MADAPTPAPTQVEGLVAHAEITPDGDLRSAADEMNTGVRVPVTQFICEHVWRPHDSMSGNGVSCIICLVYGERELPNGGVFWPAT